MAFLGYCSQYMLKINLGIGKFYQQKKQSQLKLGLGLRFSSQQEIDFLAKIHLLKNLLSETSI